MAGWKLRWGYEVKSTALPGVLALRGGGFLIHAKNGRRARVMKRVDASTPREAAALRVEMIAEAKRPKQPARSTPLFASYAVSLFKRKVAQRVIKSAATIDKWDSVLERILIPTFGLLPMDEISRTEIEQWKTSVAKNILPGARRKIVPGKFAPTTANDWLKILVTIMHEGSDELDFRDPTARLRRFSLEEHETYTDEDPNSLAPKLAPAFLRWIRAQFPQHFAMTLLGFVTGLRPSSLRPLRRSGPEADVDWTAGVLRVRRSNAHGQAVMNATKQGTHYTIGLPPSVMRALREHVASLEGPRADSRCEILFPSKGRGGGNTGRPFDPTPWMVSRSVLDDPFEWASAKMKLGFRLTPRGMRRTYQDLCRAAGVEDDLQKFICGHETGPVGQRVAGSRMTKLYSTFRPEETRAAIAKIAALLLAPERRTKRAKAA